MVDDDYGEALSDGDVNTDTPTDTDDDEVASLRSAVDHDRLAFRAMRKQAAKAKALAGEVRHLKEQLALRDAGLGHLNERQQDAVIGTLGDVELSAEALLAVAADLSFVQQEQTTPDERAAHERMAAATVAAPASEAHLMTLDEQIAATRSPEELKALLSREGMLAQQ